MIIDLIKPPLDVTALAVMRSQQVDLLQTISGRGHVVKTLFYGACALSLAAGLAVWASLQVSGIAFVLYAMFLGGSVLMVAGVVGLLPINNEYALLAGSFLLLSSFLFLFGLFGGIEQHNVEAFAKLGIITFIAIDLLAATYHQWIIEPEKREVGIRKLLTELDSSGFPGECIQFVEWCKTDPVIAAFQRQLANLGRHPIKAEYDAAKAWIADTERRRRRRAEEEAQARQACDMLSLPISN